ncbi:MAG: hypothetical protein AAGN46_08355 [Acidobacteriota bacterium]
MPTSPRAEPLPSGRPARRRWPWVVAFGVLALVGHVIFWYAPRARPAAPSDDLPGQLFTSAAYESALHIPYPHQNLKALAASGFDGPALDAALRLAGVLDGDLLAGSLDRLPPADSLSLAADDDGDRFAAAVRLYPLAAGFVRLAGSLGDNPWMRGGPVEIDGRAAEVAWSGRTWSVVSPPSAGAPPSPAGASLEAHRTPALLTVRLGSGRLVRQGDTFRLQRRGGRLEVVSSQSALELEAPDLAEARVPLLAVAGRPRRALFLLAPPAGASRTDLPRTVTARELGAPAWKLPTDELLRLVGRRPIEQRAGAWRFLGDTPGLRLARTMVDDLDRISASYLDLGLWLRLEPTAAELRRLADGLGRVPILSRSERRRIRDAAFLAERLEAHYDSAALLLDERGGVRFELWPRASGPSARTAEDIGSSSRSSGD